MKIVKQADFFIIIYQTSYVIEEERLHGVYKADCSDLRFGKELQVIADKYTEQHDALSDMNHCYGIIKEDS